MLLVMEALLIGQNGQVRTQKKSGSCHGNMVKNIRKNNQEYNRMEVAGESCGCKVKRCP